MRELKRVVESGALGEIIHIEAHSPTSIRPASLAAAGATIRRNPRRRARPAQACTCSTR
jgi:hypothetical protein